METETTERPEDVVPPLACLHERLIEDIVAHNGTKTGKVLCLECGTQFDDPTTLGEQQD